jgi:UDP-2-acetamido-2-deoxy-ribo-hexuluronate aminotransferase
MEFIDLKTQYKGLQANIDQRMKAVLEHGQFIMGPEVYALEERLADYVGVRHCIGVANGTDALLVAMMALGIRPGDEVITTPFSFMATAEMIMLLGAKPVFVDIDPNTYNLDPSLLERAITSKTKLIMPVSLYGQCADMDPINAIANRHGIPVVEDAAQSFGATYKGRQSGGLTTISCTSFFPSKPLGCYGDGGACFTNDDKLAGAMKRVRNHGQESRYKHVDIGLNSRLATLQAAILLAKLEVLPAELKLRAKVANKYNSLLPDYIAAPYIEPHNSSAYAQYTVRVENRDKVSKLLQERKIPTAVHYPMPLHKQPVMANARQAKVSFPMSEQASEKVLSLPFHPYLSDADIEKIITALREVTA